MEPQYLDDLAVLNKDGNDYIRLLRVYTPSSRPKEATLCELRLFSLRHAPRYSALSYCQQPESGIVNIDVRGSVMGLFPISHDLRSAMRAVHYHHWSDWLWIDALCINQSSNDEKNDQVPRMRDIYEMAYAGFIWLGDTVRTARFEPWGGALYSFWMGGKTDLERDITNPKFVSPEHRSREAHIAGLGFTYGKLMQLARLSQGIERGGVELGSFRKWCSQLDSTSTLKRLDGLRKRWHGAKYSIDILELLRLGRQSYATNARDNVYGILGLVNPQDRHQIRVDYSRAVDQVYAEMTAMIINKYQSIDFIVASFWHRTDTTNARLPSWVVDYGTGFDAEDDYLGIIRNFLQEFGHKAGGRTAPSAIIDDHASRLHLEAVLLDRVAETLELEDVIPKDFRPRYEDDATTSESSYVASEPVPRWPRSWPLAAAALLRSCSECDFPPSDPRHVLQRSNGPVHVLARKNPYCGYDDYKTCDRAKENGDMLDDILLNIESLNDELVRERLSSRHRVYEKFMNRTRLASHDTLFATECGCMGQARHDPRQRSADQEKISRRLAHKDDVRRGDIVVVPQGATKLWVLRETDVEGEYKLIIDCYVDGVMSGELMSLVESGKLKTQRYTLV